MTLSTAIERADAAMPNHMPHPEKMRHLSTLDGRIRREVLDRFADAPTEPFIPYEERTDPDPDTPLLVPAPYDEIYFHYLTAMIAQSLGETARYAECNAFFACAYTAFTLNYIRDHEPKCRGRFRF